MEVRVLAEQCQGHNRCVSLAPKVFDVDVYGNAVVLVAGELPAELEAGARLAASSCPEEAIEIIDTAEAGA
jgi:ferredoxin